MFHALISTFVSLTVVLKGQLQAPTEEKLTVFQSPCVGPTTGTRQQMDIKGDCNPMDPINVSLFPTLLQTLAQRHLLIIYCKKKDF